MNIAQELSIVRDNIAEYGMTNITQLEYDAIYQQGRADKYQEIVSEYMLLTEKQVAEIRADGIREFAEWLSNTEYVANHDSFILPLRGYFTIDEIVKEFNEQK